MKLARAFVWGLVLSAPLMADITSVPTYPGGTNESVQVNKRGVFYGDSRLVYSTSTFKLSVPQIAITTATINGTTYYFPTSQTGGYFLRTDGAGNLTWAAPSAVVTSTATDLAVLDGSSIISPNTSTVTFNSSQFIISLLGSTTASISLDPSSVTVMGPLSASTPLTLTGSAFGIDTSTFAMLGSNNQFRTNGNSTAGNVFWSTATAGGGVASAVTIVSTTSVANITPSGLTINTYGSTGVSGTGKGITASAIGATVNTAGEFSASGGSTNYGINVTAGDIKQTLTNTVLAADANGVLISTTIAAGSGGGASGTITASPQFQIPFYSLSGTTTTIQGDSAITTNGSGFLTVDGGAKVAGNRTISAFNYATLISTITASDTISNHRAGYFGCTSASGGSATCYGVASSAVSTTVNQKATALSGAASGTGTNRAAQLSASGGAANYALDVTAGDIKQTLTNTVLAADANGIIVSTTVAASGNFIQNTSTLQSGSTFYVSSGSVQGPLYLRSSTGANCFSFENGTLTLDNSSGSCFFSGPNFIMDDGSRYLAYTPTQHSYPSGFAMQWRNLNTIGGSSILTLQKVSTGTLSISGISGASGGQGALRFQDQTSGKYTQIQSSATVATSYTITLPDSPGTVGQVPSIADVVGSSVNLTWSSAGSGSSDGGTYPSFVLVDTNTVTWSVTVNASGTLISTATTPPAGALRLNSTVIEDSAGGFWTLSINTSGAIVTTSAGSFASSIRKIPLIDSSSITWILTANTSGNLITS